MKSTPVQFWKDSVEYEQWIVGLRLARIEQEKHEAEFSVSRCDCQLCQELWKS